MRSLTSEVSLLYLHTPTAISQNIFICLLTTLIPYPYGVYQNYFYKLFTYPSRYINNREINFPAQPPLTRRQAGAKYKNRCGAVSPAKQPHAASTCDPDFRSGETVSCEYGFLRYRNQLFLYHHSPQTFRQIYYLLQLNFLFPIQPYINIHQICYLSSIIKLANKI